MRLVFASTLSPAIIHELVLAPPENIKLLFDPTATPKRVEVSRPAPKSSPELAHPAEEAAPEPRVAPPAEPAEEAAPAPAKASNETANPASPANNAPASGDETLRVSVGLLESLMDLAGEMVLSRNQLHVAIGQNDLKSLAVADQRLTQVTSELQEAIMRTRLQPIGNVFGKFPRIVRDLASRLQKEILLDIRGKDVALDRSLIEGLSDPLTHMVRNAVDHGIETPAERIRAGKKGTGTIRIEARHEAGQVVVEVVDDGKGINAARVAESALKKNLVSAERLKSMSEQDKVALICLPGLSTAEKVTDVSGRGVGMDVVKTNLERLGGKIEIKSELGKGSFFRIKLPLTLAIIPSLIVAVGKERFAIPQINVDELLRVQAEDLKKRIEIVGGAEVLLLRDQIIPLVHLDRLLRTALPGSTGLEVGSEVQEAKGGNLEIAVVTTGTMQLALVVSSFHETEEIVVKPLGRHLKGLREYAGATVLGDGTVALILDVTGVAAKAELAAGSAARHSLGINAEAEPECVDEIQSLLLFHNGPGEVCATPLGSVLRIERITPDRVETAGSRRTFQYRGGSLPLVTLSDAATVQSLGETKELAVIVARVHDREVGLLAAMPVDVLETNCVIDQTTHRQTGVVGSAILRDRTTLIVDICELVDAVFPDWKEANVRLAIPAGAKDTRPILLAEDSDFFRAQIKKCLEQDGFDVLEAPDGEAAWDLLHENADNVRALVTDIEMPRLTGLQLASRVRSDGRFANLPVIALSSLASDDDIASGKAAGITEYLVKLDREELVETIHALTAAH